MDVLTDVLSTLHLQGSLYFRTELTSPWGIYVPHKPNVARFHIVIRGQGWLRHEDSQEQIPFANGDLALVPYGAAHSILDTPDTAVRPLGDVLEETQYTGNGPFIYGGGGTGTCLVCGELSFASPLAHPLLSNLPTLLHVPSSETYNQTWLDSALDFIAHEAVAEKPGSLAVINRLSEIIFIQVIRAFAEATDMQIPFLRALSDPQISHALGIIHQEPTAYLTVEKLGKLVGMSRSAFSSRFSELVGMTPHQYLSLIRLQRAADLLATSEDSIAQISEQVGYQSEAAFSTAFKQKFGLRPGGYRRKQRAG